MKTVFAKLIHHYPTHSLFTCAVPLELQLKKEKLKGMVKVQLFWFHTDALISFEGITFSVSQVGKVIVQVLEL